MTRRTVQLAPQYFDRAELGEPNDEQRTVPVIFSTGAPVQRMDWWTGERYIEKLALAKENVRLERLNNGAPVLDTHSGYSIHDQLGVVEEKSAKVNGKRGEAVLRFSRREAVTPVWTDVKDRIYRNVSVGYKVYKFEEDKGNGDKLPVRTAIDWEPYEISMVPMNADALAQTRSALQRGDQPPPNLEFTECEIVTRGASPQTQETAMSEPRNDNPLPGSTQDTPQSEFIVQPDPINRSAPATEQPAELSEAQLATKAERERTLGIRQAVRAARLPQSLEEELIGSGVSLLDASRRVFQELQRRDPDVPRTNANPVISINGDDPLVHERRGIENALLHRVNPTHFKMEEYGRKYRGLTLLETAKIYLTARGIRVTDMSKNDIAAAALGLNQRVGYHTTSDFPLLLADVAAKTLRREYDAAPQTFTLIGRRVTLPDYKPSNRLQIGEAPALLEVKEHGEYKHGTIGEGREQMQLIKYGRKFAITREALINDDVDAFSRVPAKFGRAARNLESNIAWLQILSNPLMGDGNALFSVAHNNLGGGNRITIASVGVGRASMRLQTALDSDDTTFIAAQPRFIIVPPSMETEADQFTSVITAQQIGNVNPFGGRLQVISEPRLETGIGTVAGSAIAWYLAAAAENGVDVLEYGYLDGEEGPQVESRVGFDIDGLEIKCRLDFAAKVIDWRGIYKDPGELVS